MSDVDWREGALCSGFRLERRERLDEIDSEVFLLTHEVLGCRALAIKNEDPNKTLAHFTKTKEILSSKNGMNLRRVGVFIAAKDVFC